MCAEMNDIEKKINALWELDYKNRSYDESKVIEWDKNISKDNFFVVKGIVKPKRTDEKNQETEGYKEYKNWVKNNERKIADHYEKSEKSFIYYLSQINKQINGGIQPTGVVGHKYVVTPCNENNGCKDEYKYYIGSEIIGDAEADSLISKYILEIQNVNDAFNKETENESETALMNCESNFTTFTDKLYHKWMMICSVKGKINLLFVDGGLNDLYKLLIPKGNSMNWVEKNRKILKYLCDILQLGNADKLNYSQIRSLSSLAWEIIIEKNELFDDISRYKQIVYTGAPGTGKTYGIRRYVKLQCLLDPIVAYEGYDGDSIKQYDFVQFHSSYDYSDFMEGLRPAKLIGSNDTTFVRMDGVFKRFCRNVVKYNKNHSNVPQKDFYFIIDEINRADLGKVFGELMFGLEENYRGEENGFETQYQNLSTWYYNKKNKQFDEIKIENDDFAKGFYIPENVHIIGSMNDIDRSVETFDFALRRRFQWKNIGANTIMEDTLKSIYSSSDSCFPGEDEGIFKELVNCIKKMNIVISGDGGGEYSGTRFRLNDSYQIGPAYFKGFDGTEESLNVIWYEKIRPILFEYVRGYGKDEIEQFITMCHDELFGNDLKKILNKEDEEQ